MYIAIAMMLVIVAISVLLPQFFRKMIDDYLPNKGNFDKWVTDTELGGGKLNLGIR